MAGRKKTVSDQEILKVFVQTADPFLSTNEVSENIPLRENGTYRRLMELKERDLLKSKKVGQGRAWWITEEGRGCVE
jgi:DNA repair protein RadC